MYMHFYSIPSRVGCNKRPQHWRLAPLQASAEQLEVNFYSPVSSIIHDHPHPYPSLIRHPVSHHGERAQHAEAEMQLIKVPCVVQAANAPTCFCLWASGFKNLQDTRIRSVHTRKTAVLQDLRATWEMSSWAKPYHPVLFIFNTKSELQNWSAILPLKIKIIFCCSCLPTCQLGCRTQNRNRKITTTANENQHSKSRS